MARQGAIDVFAPTLQFRCMSTAEIIAQLPRLTAGELAEVQAKVSELVNPARAEAPVNDAQAKPIAADPALGIWKDRTDLSQDPVQASKQLRERVDARCLSRLRG